jgi:hypothetical protein
MLLMRTKLHFASMKALLILKLVLKTCVIMLTTFEVVAAHCLLPNLTHAHDMGKNSHYWSDNA